MYYVPEECEQCGFYECEACGTRFLDIRIAPRILCPYCGKQADMEVGPDDPVPQQNETAILQEVIEGAENVEKYETLLSLAITGGDYSWI